VISVGRLALTAGVVMLLARTTKLLEPELTGLPGLIKRGSVCIDVGAAAGLYTVALSRLVGPEGLVHSVEPVSFAHPGWRRVLGSRSGENVRHHAAALGAEPGSGKMSVPVGRLGPVTGRSFLDWNCTGRGSNAEFAGEIEVPVEVQTLDGFCQQAGMTRLDFIKIDVEGGEMHILKGGERAIEKFRPAMLIEIEARHQERYQYSPDEVAGWLTDRGYSMHVWQNQWQQVTTISPHARNYLFLPSGWHGNGHGRTSRNGRDAVLDDAAGR
jgi:FkbM family methyltransferase